MDERYLANRSNAGTTVFWDDSPDVRATLAGLTVNSSTETLPENTKTMLYRGGCANGLRAKVAGNNRKVAKDVYLMADIVDVSIIESNGKKKVVVITFDDKTKEKAVLDNADTFSLEQAISICIAKKMFSDKVGKDIGGSVYNKVIDRGMKVYKRSVKMAEKKAAEESAKKEKYKKLVLKKQVKRMKREAAERENQIEIQKEAYLRAMHEFHTRSAD